MADRLSQLAARKKELAAARAELREEARRVRAAEAVEARAWVLPEHVRNVTLILFDLAQSDAEPAAIYLDGVARQRGWPKRSDDDIRTFVEDAFLEATATQEGRDAFCALADPADPADVAAMRIAASRFAEWQVVVWTRVQNEAVGQTGCAAHMLDHLETVRLRLPSGARPPLRGASSEGKNRKWLSRLRKRYRGRVGKLKVRDVLSQEEMLAKARRRPFLVAP